MIHIVRFIVGWIVIFVVLLVMTSGDPLGLSYAVSCGSPIWHLLSYWVGWAAINGIMWLGIQFIQFVFSRKPTRVRPKDSLHILTARLDQEQQNTDRTTS